MLKGKSKNKYKDHEETIEHLLVNQQYITDSAQFLIDSLREEKDIMIEEGKRLKNKSSKIIEIIDDEKHIQSDFIACIRLFSQFVESIGNLEYRNYTAHLLNTNFSELENLVNGLQDSLSKTSKENMIEKLSSLSKMRTLRSK